MKLLNTFEEFVNEQVNIPGIGWFKHNKKFIADNSGFGFEDITDKKYKLEKGDTIEVTDVNVSKKRLTISIVPASKKKHGYHDVIIDYDVMASMLREEDMIAENNNVELNEAVINNKADAYLIKKGIPKEKLKYFKEMAISYIADSISDAPEVAAEDLFEYFATMKLTSLDDYIEEYNDNEGDELPESKQ